MKSRASQIQSITLWGALANTLLTVLKFLAGILGGSAAMVADAVHSASDLVSDIIVVIFARISAQGRDSGHDYGHGKFETLATLVVSVLLLVAGVEMAISAYKKICIVISGDSIPAPGSIALWAALLSIFTKEVLYQWTVRVGKRLSSQAVIANAWHHRTDAFSSVGSLLGIGGAIWLGGRWTVLDPVACAVISIVVVVVAVHMAVPALSELTEASLSAEIKEKIRNIACSVEGVRGMHALKTRQCGSYCIVEFHIVVDPQMSILAAHDITLEIEKRLKQTFGNEMQISIHVEPSDDAL